MAEYNLFKIIGRLEFGKARDQNQGVKTVPQTTEEKSMATSFILFRIQLIISSYTKNEEK